MANGDAINDMTLTLEHYKIKDNDIILINDIDPENDSE